MPDAVAEPRIVVGEDFQHRLRRGEERPRQDGEFRRHQFPGGQHHRQQQQPRAGARRRPASAARTRRPATASSSKPATPAAISREQVGALEIIDVRQAAESPRRQPNQARGDKPDDARSRRALSRSAETRARLASLAGNELAEDIGVDLRGESFRVGARLDHRDRLQFLGVERDFLPQLRTDG